MRLDSFVKNSMLVFIISIIGILDVSPIFAQEKIVQPSQEASPKCWALDVVVVVDMSGSMRINDPDNYRFDAVDEVIYELATNKQEECQDAAHRIGLVTFSSEAISHIKLKNITIRAEDNTTDWINDVFGNAVSDAKYVTAADTSFEAAFEMAKTMFEEAPKLIEPSGYGERRQLVVFITDGKPTHSLDGSQKPTEALMCDWIGNLQQDSWKGKSIWVLPLYANDSYLDEEGCNKTIRQNFEEISIASGGKLAEFIYNNQTIPSFVFELIADEFGQTTQKVSCNDVFYIDPYLASVKLSFFSEKNEDSIYVTLSKLDEDTNEDILSFQNGQVVINKNNVDLVYNPDRDYRNPRQGKEQYTIYNPTPGKWRYQVEGMSADECVRNVEGTKIQVLPEVNLFESGKILPQMPDAPYYDVNYPTTFTLNLLNSDTNLPVANVKDYPLMITIKWELPSGSRSLPDGTLITSIELFPTETDSWENKNFPILTPELGVYKLEITGSAKTGDKSGDFVLFKETRTFEVRDLERIQFALLEPEAGAGLSCNEFWNGQSVGKPLNVTVQLQDANGQPILPSSYLTRSQFSAEYVDQTGALSSVSLISDENGLLKGTLFANTDEVTGCGIGNLTVRFDGEYDLNRYSLMEDEIVLPVERVTSKGVVVQSVIPEQDSTVLRFASTLDACSIEKVQPISIVFSLADLDGNQLDPRDLMVEGKDALYQVRVKAPGSTLWEDLDVTFQQSSDGSVLIAKGGKNIQEIGKYTVEISPVEYAFARGYVADSSPIIITFYRQDNIWTTRVACYSGWSLITIALVAFLGLIWYFFTGGPGGMVHFLDDNQDDIKSIRLSSMRIMNFRKYKYSELKDKGIDFVQFSRDSIGKDLRFVHIKAVDTSGETIWDSEIQANQPIPMTQGVIVEYSHPKHKDHDDFL